MKVALKIELQTYQILTNNYYSLSYNIAILMFFLIILAFEYYEK